jgi:hypothetical protein
MEESEVMESLRLGSIVDKDECQMGKFGMGLVTASLSIGSKLRVISKSDDGTIVTGVLDPNVIKSEKKWIAFAGEASEEDKEIFSQYLKDAKSGTIISIFNAKCNAQPTRNQLPAFLGRVYRYFIQSGTVKLFVGSSRGSHKEIHAIDPLEWDCSEKLYDDFVEIDHEGKKGRLYLKFSLLSKLRDREGKDKDGVLPIAVQHQGIYVMRNQREILAGDRFGDVWKFHPETNYARCEISFGGEMDDVLGVTFDKTNLKEVPQSVSDKLDSIIRPLIGYVKNKYRKEHVANTSDHVRAVMDKAESRIASKKALLELPLSKTSQRKKGDKSGAHGQGTGAKSHTGGSKEITLKKNIRFATADFTSAGPLFQVDPDANSVIVITWNVSHPFYQKYLEGELDSDDNLEALQYLIASLATAQIKYLGEESMWATAQNALEQIAKDENLPYEIFEGEAAFYGPKIDFMFKDAIGRERQLGTVQLDFNMPARFGLEYTDKDGTKKTPVMIHRAIAGSLERFLSIIIEHYAGNFPFWMAPIQVAIIPIGDVPTEVAQSLHQQLKDLDIRSTLLDSKDNFGKKVKRAKDDKIPYFIIIGDKDIEANKVTLESRDDGQLGQKSQDEIIELFKGLL